jgi:chromate reductase
MKTVKILAFAGSTRKDSFNKKLIKVAVAGAQQAGAEVTLIDLKDYPMPLYDGDLEKDGGIPENAKKLKKIFSEHQGFLISSPEYNSSISGVLKNTIDWVSRPTPDEEELAGFKNKVAGLMSASPGRLGGLRGLVHVRMILQNIGVLVIPQQVAVSQAKDAFDDKDALKDAKQEKTVKDIGKAVTELLQKIG